MNILRQYSRVIATAGLPLATAAFVWNQSFSSDSASSSSSLSASTITTTSQNKRLSSEPSSPAKKAPIFACGVTGLSRYEDSKTLRPSAFSSTPASNSSFSPNRRTKQTWVDEYYKVHKTLPEPRVMHMTLPTTAPLSESRKRRRIFVIGDVHGCFEELQHLYDTAKNGYNEGNEFDAVIVVGDLCNKGPLSAQVIRWVRTQPNWYAVRGNHDNGALEAAIGDSKRRQKSKYQWVKQGEEEEDGKEGNPIDHEETILSDDDVIWLAELPYTITIPASYFHADDDTGNKAAAEDVDTLIVHAGLVPNRKLEDQEIDTMITIREVVPVGGSSNVQQQRYAEYSRKNKSAVVGPETSYSDNIGNPVPWASVWSGPQRVIFGHDARRGLQQYPPWAFGLDTGAVYGKQLTGMILPNDTLVQVSSRPHSPIGGGSRDD